MTPFTDYYVIFGAAIREPGMPSRAMERRVRGAIQSAAGRDNPVFLVTGGVGRYPPSEASLMAKLLRAQGIGEGRIVLEDQAQDTLDSAIFCAWILKRDSNLGRVVLCTDGYHLFRCRVLFFLLGLRTVGEGVEGSFQESGAPLWCFHILREWLALIYHPVALIPMLAWRNLVTHRALHLSDSSD